MDALDEVVRRYDSKTAAGILARAALQLERGHVASQPSIPDEELLRSALIADTRLRLGLQPDDASPEVIDRIGSYLDDQSERLLGKPKLAEAFERLIVRGDFPSDLYEIKIASTISNFFGTQFNRERTLIERTVRSPNREQHFGMGNGANAPHLISLFARDFKTPFPARNFTMLVAGQRGNRQTLEVRMAWRLYPSRVSVDGARDLVELLRRFADAYGVDITVDGQRGRFFLTTSHDVPEKSIMDIDLRPGKKVNITRFVQRSPETGKPYAALVMAVDLERYRATLEHWDCSDIF